MSRDLLLLPHSALDGPCGLLVGGLTKMAEDEGWWEPMRQTMLREQTERAMKAEAALQEAKGALEESETARASLRMEVQAWKHNSRVDNEFLIGQRDALRLALAFYANRSDDGSTARSALAALQPGEAPDS